MLKIKNKKAFTLIELLVVVLIIAILAAIALPKYWSTVEKVKGTERLAIAYEIAKSQQRYFLAQNAYATNLDQLDQNYTQASLDDMARKNISVTPFNGNGAVEVGFVNPTPIFNYKIYVCLENRTEDSWQQGLVACAYNASNGSASDNKKACSNLCDNRPFMLNFGGESGCVISYISVR